MRLNMDYYHWGPAFQNKAGEWVYGHLTGSGLPMRFVDERGRILNIYQQLTQLADDHMMYLRWGGAGWKGHVRLGVEAALEASCALLRRSVSDHCAIAANFHADQYHIAPVAADDASHRAAAQWHQGTLDCAVEHGIPIWSAAEWLHFSELRHDANLANIEWNTPALLSFDLEAATDPGIDLNLMLPLRHGERGLSELRIDGLDVPYRTREVGGIEYGWVSVPAGNHKVMVMYA
jgi:hypothetical protein